MTREEMYGTIFRYAKQPSTLRGITLIAAMGALIAGVPVESVVLVVGAVLGGIEVVKDEDKKGE